MRSYEMGDMFRLNPHDSGEEALARLCQVDTGMYVLMPITSWNRWTDPMEMPISMSRENIDRLTGHATWEHVGGRRTESRPNCWQPPRRGMTGQEEAEAREDNQAVLRIRQLEALFCHVYLGLSEEADDDGTTCASCGLPLDDNIHRFQTGPEIPVGDEQGPERNTDHA